MVRCSVKSGVVVDKFPRRTTWAAAPFSTCGPSGESENGLVVEIVQVPPCEPAVVGKFQYEMSVAGEVDVLNAVVSVVQKLLAHGWMNPLPPVVDTASCGGLLASASLNTSLPSVSVPNLAIW
jgi:hypothetical protein